MLIQRQSQRLATDIPVTITTVLDSLEGIIVDISIHGAQIGGCGLAKGTRFQIEYMGQTVFAQCMWSEIDRMGVKFAFPLTEGPLFDRLQMALAKAPLQAVGFAPGSAGIADGRPDGQGQPRGFGGPGRAPGGGFGRRHN